MSKLPMMTIDQLFQWRDRSVAERSQTTPGDKKFERITSRIAAIDAILDTALMVTIGEVAPDIQRYLRISSEEIGTLKSFMPASFIKALPEKGSAQIQISFEEKQVEDVECTPVQPSKSKVEVEVINLMSKNFVDNISRAIEVLNEGKMGRKYTNSEAWAKIREICRENGIQIVGVWEKYISGLLSNENKGPIGIYSYLNEKLKGWPAEELGVMSGMLIEEYIKSPKTPMSVAKETQDALEIALSRPNLKKMAKDKVIVEIIKSKNSGISDQEATKEAEMVLTLMNPSKRDRVLTAVRKRKAYVEKGYPS